MKASGKVVRAYILQFWSMYVVTIALMFCFEDIIRKVPRTLPYDRTVTDRQGAHLM